MPGIGLTSWLSFVVSYCEFGILGQVWYLIVSIPDICTLTFFYSTSIICLQILLPSAYIFNGRHKFENQTVVGLAKH